MTKVSLSQVIIEEEKLEQIESAISQLKYHKLIFEDWGFNSVFEKGTAVSLLFYGIPGTGKTLMAQAICDHLDLQMKLIGTAEIETSEPGGAERNIKRIFAECNREATNSYDYGEKASCIVFDECDSLLMNREEVGPIIAAQINTLLSELERYLGVVIFTTNRLGRLDPALERRITAKIEFSFPDKKQRALIWRKLIPMKAPLSNDVNFEKLAKNEIAGGNIKNAILNAARRSAYLKRKEISMDCFEYAIEREMEALEEFWGAFNKTPKHARPIGNADYSRERGKISIRKSSKEKVMVEDMIKMED